MRRGIPPRVGAIIGSQNPLISTNNSCWVQMSASCRSSGVCSGPAGKDGWAVTAWGCAAASQAPVMHVYATCSQPTE